MGHFGAIGLVLSFSGRFYIEIAEIFDNIVRFGPLHIGRSIRGRFPDDHVDPHTAQRKKQHDQKNNGQTYSQGGPGTLYHFRKLSRTEV